jgi:hypothetical protein
MIGHRIPVFHFATYGLLWVFKIRVGAIRGNGIAELGKDNLFILQYDLGKLIRNEEGLWKDNIPFLLECQRIKGMDGAMIPNMSQPPKRRIDGHY